MTKDANQIKMQVSPGNGLHYIWTGVDIEGLLYDDACVILGGTNNV